MSEYIAISKVRQALYVRPSTVPNYQLNKEYTVHHFSFHKQAYLIISFQIGNKNADVSLNIFLTSIALYVNGSSQHKKSRIYRETHFLHFTKQLSPTECSSLKSKIVCKSWYDMCIRPSSSALVNRQFRPSRAKTRLSKPITRTCIKHECSFTLYLTLPPLIFFSIFTAELKNQFFSLF